MTAEALKSLIIAAPLRQTGLAMARFSHYNR
jgi:hypothetical protein